MEHLTGHLKSLGILAVSQGASLLLEDVHMIASIAALICGCVTSLAVAYHYIKKPKK